MKTFSAILFLAAFLALMGCAEAPIRVTVWGGLVCLTIMGIASELWSLADKKEHKNQ